MNRDFMQVPDNLWKLGNEEAKLITVIESWSYGKKTGEHYMSKEEYCKKYYLKPRNYNNILKKLKDYGIIEVVRRLPNNRQVLRINQDELDFVLDKGYYALDALPPGTPCTATKHTMPSSSAPDAQLECTPCPTHILDKVPDKVTIKDTIKDTRPEEFSFDIFKEEVKPDDIDLKLAALALDFDNDY